MIITDHFVFLHLPKTGGTFVSEVLHEVYATRPTWWSTCVSLFRKGHHFRTRYGSFVHCHPWHGTREEIPPGYRDRPLLSCLRPPLERYVSIYEFGWWKRPELLNGYRKNVEHFETRFPTFPNLSFRDFLHLLHECRVPQPWRHFEDPDCPGLHTWQTLRQLARKPHDWTKTPSPSFEQIVAELRDIHFLKTESLNEDLFDFLAEKGLSDLAFIRNKPRVLPGGRGRNPNSDWESYYDPQLKTLMETKDRGLIEFYSELKAS